ncbi:thiamine pyrophosphate-requiring protein [Streptomyces sp. NPDC058284]|uniref:thiamine pyrophosphate-requiring protein n=1 Tax=unclassified Streptomyces TaxID=2593676 RepID=UPI003669CE7B
MSVKVADHILERLRAWGVEQVFGCPGDGVDGLLAAWGRAGGGPRFVRSRHEGTAAFEAVGHAKSGDRLGVCVAASGPGAVRLLGGLYDARPDHVPVLAVVGRTDRGATDGPYQPEIDLHALFKDVAGDFVETVTEPGQLPDVIDRAIHTAYARRCPTAVIVPADVQEREYSPSGGACRTIPSVPGRDGRATTPSPTALRRAAEVLNAGEKAAVLIGRGAAGARAEVEEIAELLGAGVAKTLLGKDALSDELPYVTGAVGPLGTRPSHELMRDCDTLLTIGTGVPCAQVLPESGKARGVRIDVDACPAGTRHPYEVDLVGDARATLRELIPLIDEDRRAVNREWRDEIRANVTRWHAVLERRAALSADPVNPEHVARALDPLLPDNAVVTCDSGSVAAWFARHLTLRGDMRASLSGTLATTGCGVPYAIGAKFAHPDRPVIALVGDGAMQRNGMAELITAAEYRHLWDDPRLVVGVWNNQDLNRVTWGMRAVEGAPSFLPAQSLPDVPYAEFARSIGLTGIRVERPEDVGAAWRAALAAPGPAVLDFRTDPAVPPLPPHATWAQLEATATAVVKGDADRVSMVRQGLKAKVQEFLPSAGAGSGGEER